VYHPLDGKTRNMKLHKDYIWMTAFVKRLKEKRKIALRLGKLDPNNCTYTLKYDAIKKLCNKSTTVDDLTEFDFEISFKQKGVDMKIGMDIASLAYKCQVSQIVLIAGDSDFVPASKLARREGIDVVLDPMEMQVPDDLAEHIDGKRSCGNPYINRAKSDNTNYTV